MGSGNNGQTVHGNGGGASFWGDENVLEILILAQPCDYTKNTKLHTLKWCILWYINHVISFKKKQALQISNVQPGCHTNYFGAMVLKSVVSRPAAWALPKNVHKCTFQRSPQIWWIKNV